MHTVTRREFIGAIVTVPASQLLATPSPAAFKGPICLFSKHLPMLDGRNLGRTVKGLGFDGVDLTVRPKGHVDPARVAQDLPAFVEAIRAEGAVVPMITTDLHSDAE